MIARCEKERRDGGSVIFVNENYNENWRKLKNYEFVNKNQKIMKTKTKK